MNRIIVAIGIFFLLLFQNPALGAAGASKDLSLPDAILLALRYNPSVRSAEIQRVIDKFNLRLAENALEVQYALIGAANYTNGRLNGVTTTTSSASISPGVNLTTPIGTGLSLTMNNQVSGGSGGGYSPGLTLSVTQPLLQGAGTLVSPAALGLYNARIQEVINKLTLKSTLIQIVTQVIQQYVALVQAENTVASQELSLSRARATVQQYQSLIKAGRNASSDIVQPQADVATQEVNLQQSRNNMQQTKQALLNLLGLDATTPITVPTHISFINEKIPSLVESIRLALRHNIGYQQQLLGLAVLKRQLLVSEDQARPKLDLNVTSSLGGGLNGGTTGLPSLFNGSTTNHSVGLQLNVPIDNYSVKAGIVRSRVGLEQAKINLEGAKRQIETQVTATFYSLISQKQQITQAKEAVKLANNSLEIAKTKQKYGRVTPFEVTSLQNALLSAEIAEINSEISYLVTLANFDQLLGLSLDRWKINIRY